MFKHIITADPNYRPAKPSFGLITTGDYVVQVTKGEFRKTQSGEAVSLEFQVIDNSPFRNRRVWVMLNHDHPDDAVVARAYDQLQALCKAVGFAGELTDPAVFEGKTLTARIYETKPKEGYEAKNSANRFRPANWLYPPTPAPTPAPVEQATVPVEPPASQPMTASDRARALLAAHKAKQQGEPPF